MAQLIQVLLYPFRHHKMKIFLALLIALVFFVLLFPGRDLSDYASAQATRATGIYMQFDDLSLNFIPAPGVHAANVLVQPPGKPPIKASSIDVAVSLLSALAFKTGITAELSDVFKGSVAIQLNDGDRLRSGDRAKIVDLRLQKVSLAELSDYLRDANLAPIVMQGTASASSSLTVDATFAQQPSGSLNADVTQFSLPSQKVPANMNGAIIQVDAPAVDLSRLQLQAKLGNGNLDISNLTFGGPSDGLSGKMSGSVSLNMVRGAMGVMPILGQNGDLTVDLTVKNSFITTNAKAGIQTLLMFIEKSKKEQTADQVRYSFRVRLAGGQAEILPQ